MENRKQLNRFWGSATLLGCLILAGGAIIYATIPDSTGIIHGCYQNNKGSLRVINYPDETCDSSEMAVAWNQTGPQGSQGPQGAQGLQGPPGASGLSHGYSSSNETTIAAGDPSQGQGFKQVVLIDNLPAGSYLISASTYLAFTPCELCIGPPRLICNVLANGNLLVESPFMSPVAIGGNSADKAVIPFTTSASFANSGGKVEIVCSVSRDVESARGYLNLIAVNALN